MIKNQLMPISPYLYIEDYSLYFFILFCSIGLSIIIFLVKFLLKWNRKRKYIKFKNKFENLKNIDFSDTKIASYKITYYGRFFLNNKEIKLKYTQLNENLEKYKYRKENKIIDNETKNMYDLFIYTIELEIK
jgi:hypothetical protein